MKVTERRLAAGAFLLGFGALSVVQACSSAPSCDCGTRGPAPSGTYVVKTVRSAGKAFDATDPSSPMQNATVTVTGKEFVVSYERGAATVTAQYELLD